MTIKWPRRGGTWGRTALVCGDVPFDVVSAECQHREITTLKQITTQEFRDADAANLLEEWEPVFVLTDEKCSGIAALAKSIEIEAKTWPGKIQTMQHVLNRVKSVTGSALDPSNESLPLSLR